jgi:hypothetical protein
MSPPAQEGEAPPEPGLSACHRLTTSSPQILARITSRHPPGHQDKLLTFSMMGPSLIGSRTNRTPLTAAAFWPLSKAMTNVVQSAAFSADCKSV